MRVRGDGLNIVGGHGITGHDFTGRWLGECHAIGWRSYYVLHVSCVSVSQGPGEDEQKLCGRRDDWKGNGNRKGYFCAMWPGEGSIRSASRCSFRNTSPVPHIYPQGESDILPTVKNARGNKRFSVNCSGVGRDLIIPFGIRWLWTLCFIPRHITCKSCF